LREIAICTYFKSEITPPEEIKLYDGDNSVRGFIRALKTALKENEYDVIHVHTPHAGVLLILTLLVSGLSRKMQPKSVHTIQNSWQNFKPRNQLLHLPSFYYFQHLVFCSHASYDSFPQLLKWLGRNRMHVVQNAVDLDRIDRISKQIDTPSQNGHFNVSTIGLIKMKNPLTVLEAFHQSADPPSKLVYMGEGNLRPKLSREIERFGLGDQVTLTGMIERDNIFEHFMEADLFVSASWGEGLPVAVLEAMACRCPVLLSDIPPHREVAQGADFIPLVKPDDVLGFAHEIKKFKSMSASERKAIGQECREVIERRFTLASMHEGLADIYSQITGHPIITLPY
jgi:glycosyltransferase involved in cell wall biosynthesis